MRRECTIASIIALFAVSTILSACQLGEATSSEASASAQAEETTFARLDSFVSVTGEVLPLQWAEVSFATVGTIDEVRVGEGDEVVAGQVLATLDLPELEAAALQAKAAVAVAASQLARLEAAARPEEVLAAELAEDLAQQGVVAAQILVDTAVANRLAAAATLEGAQASLARLEAGPRPEELEVARQEVERAKALLYSAQGNRDAVGGRRDKPGYQGGSYEAAEGQMMAAETAVTVAQMQQQILQAGARAEEIAGAEAQVSQARAALQGAETQERAAKHQVAISRVQVRQAQTQLALVKAGVREEDIAVARAQLSQAEAAVRAAEAAAEKAELLAPFAGTVTEINIRAGEYVVMGNPAMAIGDISSFRVEITDLDEIDVARVDVGSTANLTFDALPGTELEGVVRRIALKASAGAGGTAYKTIITFDTPDPRLRWGMTAFADIVTGPVSE